MKRIHRTPLPARTLTYLGRKQQEVDSGIAPEAAWTGARKTKTMNGVASTLAAMSGKRQRCMFCGDSRGTDIDHFWPKSRYREHTFDWLNLLWICAGCNRQKGNQFPLDAHQRPLLIDPTAEDPWDYLLLDSHTGNITARFDPTTG